MKRSKRVLIVGFLIVGLSLACLLYLSLHLNSHEEFSAVSNNLLHQSQQVAEHVDGVARLLQFVQRIIAH